MPSEKKPHSVQINDRERKEWTSRDGPPEETKSVRTGCPSKSKTTRRSAFDVVGGQLTKN